MGAKSCYFTVVDAKENDVRKALSHFENQRPQKPCLETDKKTRGKKKKEWGGLSKPEKSNKVSGQEKSNAASCSL